MFAISLSGPRRAKPGVRVWVGIAAACVVSFAGRAQAQDADSSRCDSVIVAARRDSVRTALYLTVIPLDVELSDAQRKLMATAIGTAFVPPRPFRISVFSGPSQMRTFRRIGADTLTELRAPTVTGMYRFSSTGNDSTSRPVVVRASLIPGLDAAVLEAIRSALLLSGVFIPPVGFASMQLDVRLASDSTPNALRIVEAIFPRMPVIDAVPYADNPPPKLPLAMPDDSTRRFDVVLRFVVDRAGLPALETVEVIRGSSLSYVREAFNVLPKQRFTPARVNGCAVAQVVSYPFAFVTPPAGALFRH